MGTGLWSINMTSEELLDIFTSAATDGDWILFREYGKRDDTLNQIRVMRQVAKREGYNES
jgi:hypothetical protein